MLSLAHSGTEQSVGTNPGQDWKLSPSFKPHPEKIFLQLQKTCSCGRVYWSPNQDWIHKDCASNQVANSELIPELIANVESVKVANKTNRHGVYKDKEARLKYMREYMRKRRADAQGQR